MWNKLKLCNQRINNNLTTYGQKMSSVDAFYRFLLFMPLSFNISYWLPVIDLWYCIVRQDERDDFPYHLIIKQDFRWNRHYYYSNIAFNENYHITLQNEINTGASRYYFFTAFKRHFKEVILRLAGFQNLSACMKLRSLKYITQRTSFIVLWLKILWYHHDSIKNIVPLDFLLVEHSCTAGQTNNAIKN